MRDRLALVIISAVSLIWGCADPAPTPATVASVTQAQAGQGAYQQVADFGANPGGLAMYRYVPPNPRPGAPLVVAMHACTQNAAAYRSAGWEPLADEFGFYVVYPEQTQLNNGAGCFNWAGEYGDPTNLRRGEGENRSIISMIEHMQAEFDIDPGRIFATGHSGGAAQAALMMATWPDVFAGGAMIAGIPYNCTTAFAEVSSCLNPGRPRAAAQWAQSVFDAFPGFAGTYPKISVWQGTADFTVAPVNGTEMVKQWTAVHGLGERADVTEQVAGHQRSVWFDADGEAVVESYTIQGGGHGTFVDPDRGCGSPGAFFVDNNICSSRRIADFFGITGEGPDVPPVQDPEPDPEPEPEPVQDPEPIQDPEPAPEPEPVGDLTIDIVSPADGAVLSGVVIIEAAVSDPTAQVTFAVNDIIIGVALSEPYTAVYNAILVGEKTITATARTAAGEQAVASIRARVGDDPGGEIPPGGEVPDGEAIPTICSAAPGAPTTPTWLLLALPLAIVIRRAR